MRPPSREAPAWGSKPAGPRRPEPCKMPTPGTARRRVNELRTSPALVRAIVHHHAATAPNVRLRFLLAQHRRHRRRDRSAGGPLHSIITGSTSNPQAACVTRQLAHPRSRRDPARSFCFAQRCPDRGTDAACLRGVDIAQSKANAIDVAAIGVVPINRADRPFRRRGGCWGIRGHLRRWRLHFRGRRRMARG